MDADLDKVFKAIADPGRRLLLDRLHTDNGQTLGRLCEHLDMTRQAVTKHLKVLEEASLVVPIWRNEFKPELRDEIPTRLTYELEQQGEAVKLTVIHESEQPGSKLIEAVSSGWPMILASLKSLVETGESLEATRRWPEGV